MESGSKYERNLASTCKWLHSSISSMVFQFLNLMRDELALIVIFKNDTVVWKVVNLQKGTQGPHLDDKYQPMGNMNQEVC